MSKWVSISVMAAFIFMLGCGQPPSASTPPNMEINATSSRVSIQRIMVFEDDLAYGDKRGIYIIRDHVTNKEFIGVSGIGISEIGHNPISNGKVPVMVRDER